MKTNILKMIVLLLPAVAMPLSGCTEKQNHEPQIPDNGRISVAMSASGSFNEYSDDGISEVRGYRFTGGLLQEIMVPESRDAVGKYSFRLESRTGQIHFTANLSSLQTFRDLEPGTALDDFLNAAATAEEMTGQGTGMTGILDLDLLEGNSADVKLARTVARLDISSYENGVRVLKAEVSGFRNSGRIFPSAENSRILSEQGEDGGIVLDFSGRPLENSREVLAYIPEQSDIVLTVKVTVSHDGGYGILSREIPMNVRRNEIYNISVSAKGAGLTLEVQQGEWENGGVAGSVPSLRGLVDVENSVLPDGVRVNGARDTVYVSYRGADFSLALLAEPSAEVVVDGNVSGVEVKTVQAARTGLEKVAEFSVSARRRLPGRKAERMHLDVYHGGAHAGRVVLVFGENPARLEGILVLDNEGVCDFGRYADGEFGTVTLPEDRILTVEFPDGEAEWMKVEKVSEGRGGNVYRVLGGWRPNDRTADGRVQEGFLVISGHDGSDVESYSVKRRNWGLPVVKMGDTWWTLYNLRGDAGSFEDQVTCGSEPAGAYALYDYLQSVPETELLELMGDQYQAGNRHGLPLSFNGSAFLYDGMKTSAQDFGVLDPSLNVPDGYEIPSYDDCSFFAASENFNLGGVGARSFVNMAGETVEVKIAEREVSFLGHEYGTVAFYEFLYGEESWVLYGLGHQWNTVPGNIAKMHLLIATHGTAGKTWVMEGYSSSDRPGQNWIKFVANNNTKTRMIRCVKTPVEYMY